MSSKKRHLDELLEDACNVLAKSSAVACAVERLSPDGAKDALQQGTQAALEILERAQKLRRQGGASSPPGQAAALQAAEQLSTENKEKDELIKQLQEQVKQLVEQHTGHGHQASEPETENFVERLSKEIEKSPRAVVVCVLHPKSAFSWLISKDLSGTDGLEGKSDAVQRWSKKCSEFHKQDFFCTAEDLSLIHI